VVLVLLGCLGYIVVLGLAYGDLDEHTRLFHIESEWTCIGIIMATPFVFRLLPAIRPGTAAAAASAIVAIRLAYVLMAVPVFSWRIHFHEEVLTKMKQKGITKLAIYKEWDFKERFLNEWGAGYESLLLTAMNGEKPNRTFVLIDRENNQPVLDALADPKKVYLWDGTPIHDINSSYFTIDSAHAYTITSYGELMK
jgi:hypothetical protein